MNGDNPHVTSIVLAAGLASRFGRSKQLLDWHGIPLVRHVAQIALASKCADAIVVTGNESALVGAAVADLPVVTVENPTYRSGLASSVHVGLMALPDHVDAIVTLLADQPGVSTQLINQVIATWLDSGTAIIQPRYGDKPSHPVLIARSVFPEMMVLSGDEGARQIIRADPSRVAFLDLPGDPPPDIDTEADYQRALNSLPG